MYSNSIESIPSVPCFLFSFYNFRSFYNLYRHPVATDASNCVFAIVTIGLFDDCVMIHFVISSAIHCQSAYRMHRAMQICSTILWNKKYDVSMVLSRIITIQAAAEQSRKSSNRYESIV